MTFSRPRIVFVINSIGTGGAERALDTILRAASDRASRCDIHLVLLDREAERRQLPDFIIRHQLDARGALVASIRQLNRLLARLLPDLVVSLLVRANVATAIAGPRHARATVLCERMHLSSHLAGRYNRMRLRLLRLLPRLLYQRADRILAVSMGVGDDLVASFGVPRALIDMIPNGYDLSAIEAAGAAPSPVALPDNFIVAVGRLVAAKGFALLIDAYRTANPPLPLLILGEGPLYATLRAQADDAGLGDRIQLLGYVEDPFPVIARSSFLVSASYNEGFPNAIAEAMVLRRPIVATDCPSGPAELLGAVAGPPGSVVEAPYGLIVPDGDRVALASAITRLSDPALAATLGAAARQRLAAFGADEIAGRYWTVFDSLLARA